ncbi:MAG: tetratricopeptide repeat protein [Candidatus Polarisedimenticolia bacterium]
MTTSSSRGWERWGIWAVLTAAAAMRAVYLLDYRAHSIFWDAMLLDAEVYDEWARSIAAGDWVGGTQVYTLAPLYPYVLAVLYALAGPSYPLVYVLQAGLGLVNIWLIHAIGRQVFGRATALIAACMAALYGSFMFMESKLMGTTAALTLGLALTRLLLAAADRPALWRWGACGALLGFTALLRPETLLAVPLVAWWIHHVSAGPRARAGRASAAAATPAGRSPASRWMAAGVFAVMVGVPILPVALRNCIVSGDWSPSNLISSQAGITFYQSNNPRARGLYYFLNREGFSGNPKTQAREEQTLAEKEVGRPLKRSEVTRYWTGRGLSWIVSDPGGFLLLEGRKLIRFFGTYEYSTEYIFHAERQAVLTLWLGWLPFAAISSLAVVGVLYVGKAGWKPPVLLLALFVVSNLLVVLAFYVSSRYRMPSAPALILFAAFGLERIVAGLRSRLASARAEGWIYAGMALVLFAVFHVQVDASSRIQEGNVHYNAGVLHSNRKQFEASIEEYRLALEVDAKNWRAWHNLGNSYAALNRRDDAVAAYREALRFNPGMEAAERGLRALGAQP